MLKELKTHTTLPVADREAARAWYEEKLGLVPESENPGGVFYVVGGGTRFVLYPAPNAQRGGHTQIGFVVSDLDAEVAELKARGVVFEEYDYPGLKTEGGIAQVGPNRSAWFKDLDGNMFGLVQLAPGNEPD